MEIMYLGHSGFHVRMGGRSMLFDPWLSNEGKEKLYRPPVSANAFGNVDLVLLSHEHFDHCDPTTVETVLARSMAHVVAPPETLEKLDVPQRLKMGVSEGERFELNGIEVTVVPAKHPQSVRPVGYKVSVGNESFFHAGDTYDFFELTRVDADVAAIPIGGTYTMDILSAITALKRMRVKHVIPMHYDTFKELKVDVREFEQRALKTKAIPHVLRPGDSLHL